MTQAEQHAISHSAKYMTIGEGISGEERHNGETWGKTQHKYAIDKTEEAQRSSEFEKLGKSVMLAQIQAAFGPNESQFPFAIVN